MIQSTKPKFLLACGLALGPLFYVVVVAQILTRSGFDIRRHPISVLSLGEAGWIQIANFILTGLLAISCAVGVRRALRDAAGGTWGPLLIATYGLGMVIAGLFPPDPLPDFPPGGLAGVPPQMSEHAMLHGVGFFVAFLSLIAACFVFARRYVLVGRPGWGKYSIATGVITPLLILVGMLVQSAASISFFVVGIVAFGWVGAAAAQLTFSALNDTQTQGARNADSPRSYQS
jgi:hypothetical protein